MRLSTSTKSPRCFSSLVIGEWFEVDPGTLTPVPTANFLSGHAGTNAFAWKATVPVWRAHAARSCSCVIRRERALHQTLTCRLNTYRIGLTELRRTA